MLVDVVEPRALAPGVRVERPALVLEMNERPAKLLGAGVRVAGTSLFAACRGYSPK
jgi:hypothetical protein